jgi:hypothetical protein
MAIPLSCHHGTKCPVCPGSSSEPGRSLQRRSQPIRQGPAQGETSSHSKPPQLCAEGQGPERCRGRSWLYRLPQEVVDTIARHLPYEALLRLRTLSRTLHRIIDPRLAAEETKIALVMHSEKDFERNFRRSEERLGCYVCYRVLRASAFATDQMARDPFAPHLPGRPPTYLRRFCIDCGLSRGYHYPGEVLERRRDFTTWWVCGCRQLRNRESTVTCCRCGMNMPLRKHEKNIEWDTQSP